MTRFSVLLFTVAIFATTPATAQEFKWQDGTNFVLPDESQTPLLDLAGVGASTVQSVAVPDSDASLDSGFFDIPAISVPGAVESSFSGIRFRIPVDGQ